MKIVLLILCTITYIITVWEYWSLKPITLRKMYRAILIVNMWVLTLVISIICMR